jgi:L-lactate dehydrogenase complex protein LldG
VRKPLGQFYKIISNLRSALESTGASRPARTEPVEPPSEPVPVATAARRAELVSLFARELERVGGHFLGVSSLPEVTARIVALAGEIKARNVALGEGLLSDSRALGEALERKGLAVTHTGRTDGGARAELRGKLSQCDLGIVEADYAVAASGTLAMIATETRPASLTLLPTANAVMVHVGRLLPDLASVLNAIGAQTVAAHRLSLVTGPSRTADIEKRIVLGVHGPKELYVLIVWPRND